MHGIRYILLVYTLKITSPLNICHILSYDTRCSWNGQFAPPSMVVSHLIWIMPCMCICEWLSWCCKVPCGVSFVCGLWETSEVSLVSLLGNTACLSPLVNWTGPPRNIWCLLACTSLYNTNKCCWILSSQ